MFHITIEKDGDGWLAKVSGWDDVYAPGDDPAEALELLAATMRVVNASYRKHGDKPEWGGLE